MTSNTIKMLVVSIAWAAFLVRGYIALRRRNSASCPHSEIPLWVIWVPTFFLLLAGTTYNERFLQIIAHQIGEWFVYVPRVGFGIIAFMIGTYACIWFRLLPDDRFPRWKWWTVMAGFLALVDFMLLRWMGWSLFPDQVEQFNHVADVVFRTYLLIASIRISLPTLSSCRIREPGILFRMRLNYLWWFTFLFTLWMIVDIFSLGKGFPLLTTPLTVGFWITFILGLFTPDSIYKKWLIHLYHLNTFLLIRFLEVLAYFIIHHIEPEETARSWKLSQIKWSESLRTPGRATYKSMISLLDTCKILNAQSEATLAGRLGRRISIAHHNDADYLEVVNHLREVGVEHLTDRQALGTVLQELVLRPSTSYS